MTSVRELVGRLDHQAGLEEFEERQKKALTVRLTADGLQHLINVANRLKMTRTGCAQCLLEAAIIEAASALQLPPLYASEEALVHKLQQHFDIPEIE